MKPLPVLSLAGLILWASPQIVSAQLPVLPFEQQSPPTNTTSRVSSEASYRPELYLLGAGDRVLMDIYGIPDYSKEYEVLVDGTLNLPLIGTVFVAGKTLDQASEEIELRYLRYIRHPAVTLSLQQARSLQVAIAGQVNRPGSYVLPAAQGDRQDNQIGEQQPLTVTQAIQLAGGITHSADIRKIQVYRPNPYDNREGQYIDANLWKLIQEGDLNQDIVLRDGDSVLVPEAAELDPAETTALASANFSPDTINVYVVGEVGEPGLVEVPPNTPMNQALLAAGGFNTRASDDSVRLVRLNPNGTVSERDISVDFEDSVNEETNPALRNNDTIVVGRSGLSAFTDVVDVLVSPFNILFDVIDIFDN